MDVILSHITALEVLRRWDSFKLVLQPLQGGDSCIPLRAPNSEQFTVVSQLSALSGATLPIHVLVRDHGHRSYTDKVFSHAPLPYYPEGSFFSIAPGVSCCGPELVTLQMVEYATNLELLLLVDGESAARIRKPDLMILAPHSQADEGVSRGTRFEAVALDYQGAYHRDPFQESKDIDRRNELLACDVKDYEIAKEHFSDVSYLNWLASRIRRDLGMEEPQLNAQEQATFRKRSLELNEQLRSIDGLHWTARSKDLVMAGAHDFFGSAIPCKSIAP